MGRLGFCFLRLLVLGVNWWDRGWRVGLVLWIARDWGQGIRREAGEARIEGARASRFVLIVLMMFAGAQ